MRIKDITSMHRRDFYAIYECEHCGHEEEDSGYDDAYFHEKVIPNMKCKECGKTSSEDYIPRSPRYSEDTVV